MRRLTWFALAVYAAVMVALTMLKAFYRIGYLWDPAIHRHRELRPVPLEDLLGATGWFLPAFGYLGNLASFFPFGVHVYMLLIDARRPLLSTVLVGFAASLTIETAQYVFALGYSDIDDLLMNTLGAFLGAVVARLCGPRWHRVWIGLALALGVVFVVLAGLGERLGDPAKVAAGT
ncbi:MAG: VanZ family protein [Corynebacterium humireducens]|uniref:VanZ family protein n=1 Tax=Corynebacterium humireducens TaxID=1223514 RepID=A0A7X6PLR6_9CORY|nr:VanZ family protein [Corynebacterium humireducens]